MPKNQKACASKKADKDKAPQQNPVVLIPAIVGLLGFIRDTLPLLQDMFKRGEISKEEMDEISREYKDLQAQVDKTVGPEWELSGR